MGDLPKGLGRHPFRPALLHGILKAHGHEPPMTRIFDPDDPRIHFDAVAGVEESLPAELELRRVEGPSAVEEAGMEGPFRPVEHDFAPAPKGEGPEGSAPAATLGEPGTPAR